MFLGAIGGVGPALGLLQTLSSGLGLGSSSATESCPTSSMRLGDVVARLGQLQASDPEKLKVVLSDLVTKLNAAAAQQPDGPAKEMFTRLANRFQQAAQTGDLSALRHHGHHRPHPPLGTTPGTQQPLEITINLSGLPESGSGNSGMANFQQTLAMENARVALQDIFSSVLSAGSV
jgi:hypothetical protein